MTTQAERTQLGFSIEGLLGSYADPTDLGYHVRNAVEQDLAVLNLGVVIARRVAEEHALLRTEYKFEREGTQDRNGRIRMRTTRERLEITNRGAVTAEGVGIELQAVGDGEPRTCTVSTSNRTSSLRAIATSLSLCR